MKHIVVIAYAYDDLDVMEGKFEECECDEAVLFDKLNRLYDENRITDEDDERLEKLAKLYADSIRPILEKYH